MTTVNYGFNLIHKEYKRRKKRKETVDIVFFCFISSWLQLFREQFHHLYHDEIIIIIIIIKHQQLIHRISRTHCHCLSILIH